MSVLITSSLVWWKVSELRFLFSTEWFYSWSQNYAFWFSFWHFLYLWGKIWSDLFLIPGLRVGVVFVLKFSGISALGRALLTHEQWLQLSPYGILEASGHAVHGAGERFVRWKARGSAGTQHPECEAQAARSWAMTSAVILWSRSWYVSRVYPFVVFHFISELLNVIHICRHCADSIQIYFFPRPGATPPLV